MKQATQHFLDLWFSGKTDGIEEIVAENFVTHMSMPGVTSTGIQQLKDMIAISAAAFPDNKMEDMHLIADGDRVVAHYQWNGVDPVPWAKACWPPISPLMFMRWMCCASRTGKWWSTGGNEDHGAVGPDARR